MCGICLAVGGDPKVLGRSSKIADYVKHGHTSGFVELFMLVSQEAFLFVEYWKFFLLDF